MRVRDALAFIVHRLAEEKLGDRCGHGRSKDFQERQLFPKLKEGEMMGFPCSPLGNPREGHMTDDENQT
jgi:hypothetical protein